MWNSLTTAWFQSRNRGSFDFKTTPNKCVINIRYYSFNLVIEVLLISRARISRGHIPCARFQSRNRGSFDFKHNGYGIAYRRITCFNLVIEVLLISSLICQTDRSLSVWFQSRNRGSFDFKSHRCCRSTGSDFVSIS